ncbi:30 kDa salivary gland allergen Aed a 3-like [Armigeres subalbatus]|uniref:30 kDa salivary gland allergen Aed a 3-like n=1 Tax=Armigeres subalbatus TaxID=124917 RepID=UPI002ED0310D
MKFFITSYVTCCLLIGSVLTWPLPEGEEVSTTGEADATTEASTDETSEAGTEDGNQTESTGENGDDGKETVTEGSGKDDRLNTYNKVNELLDKGTDVDKVDNGFLRSFLNNNLQSHLRVPIIDAVGLVGDFGKIAGCFTSMGSDVKKIVDEKLKSFTSCKQGKDSTDSKCSEDSATGGHFDQITSKIKECVSTNGKGK